MKNLTVSALTVYYSDREAKEDDMAGLKVLTRKRKMHTGFLWENLKETHLLEHLVVDRIIILKWILKTRT